MRINSSLSLTLAGQGPELIFEILFILLIPLFDPPGC